MSEEIVSIDDAIREYYVGLANATETMQSKREIQSFIDDTNRELLEAASSGDYTNFAAVWVGVFWNLTALHGTQLIAPHYQKVFARLCRVHTGLDKALRAEVERQNPFPKIIESLFSPQAQAAGATGVCGVFGPW